ncbi:hypothetical protein [Rubripirellula reticaptiva]|nr:hypothetical protein [Rubripirellula reticaptiva]
MSDDFELWLQVPGDGGTIFVGQMEVAELFQTSKQKVSLYAKNILVGVGELQADPAVKEIVAHRRDRTHDKHGEVKSSLATGSALTRRGVLNSRRRSWVNAHGGFPISCRLHPPAFP